MTGTRYERELIDLLEQYEYAVMRAPASGSATSRPLPDLTAAKNPLDNGGDLDLFALEAKVRKDHKVYLGAEEVEKLLSFADTGGYTAYVACRWKRAPGWSNQSWFFRRPDECERTDEGNYKLERPETPADWQGRVFDPDEVQA
ncbi:Holliday junction resolvase Hjc [Halococcus saccharolyticus]|uniref:Holliday junction resolvase n=1 Tax=Halococcus saccharolyticus DSM 5350 TaxID=1227455 RepID=M0MQK3_9EURY|nr:Holliday junction resolvase Hjc [Halococcus saccharolyticus]EMA47618.1 Holliday junction resolvase [Halococcus saccharolyticus DSM 5350]